MNETKYEELMLEKQTEINNLKDEINVCEETIKDLTIFLKRSNENNLWYFAHPYSKNPEENYGKCIIRTNYLLGLGLKIYSPIAMTHPLHKAKDRPYDFWINLDECFMGKCYGLILVKDQWQQSKGCCIEEEYFRNHDKPIIEIEFKG